MTAKKLAELACERIQTALMIGGDPIAAAISGGVLASIAHHGNHVPDSIAWAALAGKVKLSEEATHGTEKG